MTPEAPQRAVLVLTGLKDAARDGLSPLFCFLFFFLSQAAAPLGSHLSNQQQTDSTLLLTQPPPSVLAKPYIRACSGMRMHRLCSADVFGISWNCNPFVSVLSLLL